MDCSIRRDLQGRRARRGMAMALAGLICCGQAGADDINWSNSGGDFLWATPANWAGETLPGAADRALFGDIGVGSINLGGQARTIDTLLLSNTEGAYSLVNGTLVLNRIVQTGNSTAIEASLNAAGGLALDVQANTLSLNGPVTASGLTKTGAGLARLAGPSTLGGTTSINAGKLLVTTASAFAGGTVNLTGGTLELHSAGETFAGSYHVLADSGLVASRPSGSGGTTTIPALTLGDATLNTSTQDGLTLRTSAVTVNGTGSAVVHNQGTAQLMKTTLNGDLKLTGPGGGEVFLQAGAGTLVLDGTGSYTVGREVQGSTFNGAITINGGTAIAAVLTSTRITVNPGGTLQYTSGTLANSVIELKGGVFAANVAFGLSTTTINYSSGVLFRIGGASLVMQPDATLTLGGPLEGSIRASNGAIRLYHDGVFYGGGVDMRAPITATKPLALEIHRQAPGPIEYQLASVNLAGNPLTLTGSGNASLWLGSLVLGGSTSIHAAMPLRLNGVQQASSDVLAVSGPADVTFPSNSQAGRLAVEGPGRVKVFSISEAVVNGGTLEARTVNGSLTVNPGGIAELYGGGGTAGPGNTFLAGGVLRLTTTGWQYGPGSARVTVAEDSSIAVINGVSGSGPEAWLNTLTLPGRKVTMTNSADNLLNISSLVVSAPSVIHAHSTLATRPQDPAVKVLKATLNGTLNLTGSGHVSLSGLSGNGDLVMDGLGRVSIVGTKNNDSRNWTGQLVMNSGTVALTGQMLYEDLVRASATLVVNSGATLAVDGITSSSAQGYNFTRPLHLTGLGHDGAGALSYTNQLKDAIIAAPIALNGPTAIHVNRIGSAATVGEYGRLHIGRPESPTWAGAALTGVGPLIKIGGRDDTSVIQMNVRASYTGGTIIDGGGIILSPTGSLVNTGPVTVNPGGALGVGRPAGSDSASHSVNPNSVSLKGGSLLLMADMDPRPFLAADSTGGGILLGSALRWQRFDYTQDLNLSQLLPGVPGSAWHLGGGEFGADMAGTVRFDTPQTLRLEGTGWLAMRSKLAAANNIAALTVAGSGSVRLDDVNDYAGDTTVLSGMLHIHGDHSIGTSASPLSSGWATRSQMTTRPACI